MKTGIITYHNTRNCGAVLQAYALSNALGKIGVDCEIIDYRCKKIDAAYRLKKIWEIKNIKEFIKWMLSSFSQNKAQKKFDEFKKCYLKIGKTYDENSISEANIQYDAFVTGSDQVWNFNLNGCDENYILKFAASEKKKISYAASMGYKKIPEEYVKIFKDNLSDYDGISVREIEAKENIEELGYRALLVLDPTLLLSKEDFLKFATGNEEKKYIFVYTVANTPNIEKKAKELSKKTGLPIVWAHMSYRNKKGVKNIKNPSCTEFLNLIKNAEYILTSSFHGMALSIVMEKQFFYDLSVDKNNYNSRLTTLSDSLGLSYREINSDKDLISYENIDYKSVNALLNKKREESLSFLSDSLGK